MSTRISRPKLRSQILSFVHDPIQRICLLSGPRQAGKTTLLRQVYEYTEFRFETIWYSFDQDVVPKQFHDRKEFLDFMFLKYGFDCTKPQLLCLNEIQYSASMMNILEELIALPKMQAKIVATGILTSWGDDNEYQSTIRVTPLTFDEFVSFKGLHTAHIGIETTSKILLKELQKVYDEYLIRGGYPSVVIADHEEKKMATLRSIMQTIYEKDVGFFFNSYDILAFEPMLQAMYHATQTTFKVSALARYAEVKPSVIEAYAQFFVDHHLIELLPYEKTTSDAKEIHHQKKVVFLDPGVMTYLTKDTNSKLTAMHYQLCFLVQTLNHLGIVESLSTYKKINGSAIDLVVHLYDGRMIPIVMSYEQSKAFPKVLSNYLKIMDPKIAGCVKTSWLVNTIDKTPYGDCPYMLTQPFLITEAIEALVALSDGWSSSRIT